MNNIIIRLDDKMQRHLRNTSNIDDYDLSLMSYEFL
jgi:hypothetical protein